MDDKETRRHQMFVRVRDFGQAHIGDFAPNSLAHQGFSDLATVIVNLDQHAAAEHSGRGSARQGTQTRAEARESLRDALAAINRTARAMDDNVTGIEDKFQLPMADNDQLLLNAARAFKDDVDPLQADFIAHEMPADFLADLDADITAMEAAMSNQASGVSAHVTASASIDDTISRGNDLVRKLDVIVRNKYADNGPVLAEWTSASHTERGPRHSPPPTPPPATPTQPSA